MKAILFLSRLAGLIFFSAALCLVCFFAVPAVTREGLERAASFLGREYLAEGVRLESAGFDRSLRLHLKGVRGGLQTPDGVFQFQIEALDARDGLWRLLARKPVRFVFEGAGPQAPGGEGIRGEGFFEGILHWRLNMQAEVLSVKLEDLETLNREGLQGSSGRLAGKASLDSDWTGHTWFDAELYVREPGGMIQGRFFEGFLPYMPKTRPRKTLSALAGSGQLVHYRNADLRMSLAERDSMKIFFHIHIPDYNLNLNLNLEVRVDNGHFFDSMARLMGFAEVRG